MNILNTLIILHSHALLSAFLESFVIQAIDHALESRLSNSSIFLHAMLLRKRRDTLPKWMTLRESLLYLRKSSRDRPNFGRVREYCLRILYLAMLLRFYTKLSKAVGSFPTCPTCSHLFALWILRMIERISHTCSHLFAFNNFLLSKRAKTSFFAFCFYFISVLLNKMTTISWIYE